MVDALRSAHRAVKRGGLVIDARPDASRRPRVVAAGRVRAWLLQSSDADLRDDRADGSVARLVGRGLYRVVRSGHVWHSTRFADLTDLDAYLRDSARYAAFERGTRPRLAPFRDGPFDVRRAIGFDVLERL
ncbi:MAG: hypothetical protein KGN00_03150 [Chloroflexota bacterium]|nr:hypothetical protein [Chloroflexota bacterium]MDE3192663.1 hypothetical protein [Chloroflexota bacterium]